MLSNLRSEGMAAEDGPRLGDPSAGVCDSCVVQMAVLATVAAPM
jgi:hypothetical protein